ncbi:MAG: hypothetical protein WC889_18970, partial [Myxococcota bacterium]
MKRLLHVLFVMILVLAVSGCAALSQQDGGDGDAQIADADIQDAGQVSDAATDAGTDAAADSGNDTGNDAATDAGTDAGHTADAGVDVECGAMTEGNNSLMVAGLKRTYILNLPTGATSGGPYPVIFNWHGLGDSAANMKLLFSSLVNTKGFPFILVTPEDTGFKVLGITMDWEVFVVDADTNREALLFDKIVGCLGKKYPIDLNHIHAAGFSMGAILTDMLGTIRGASLASTATFSGGYFSDQDNVDTLG